jgi:putative hydrolase of the HAD superfamily
MVLTGPPDPVAHADLLRITGLPEERFLPAYWADRDAYDEGKLTRIGYWQSFLRRAGLPPNPERIEELNRWDARQWTVPNPAMLDWQLALKQRGLRTAILSNMSENVLEKIEREFAWIHRFDVLVWSCQLGMAKPAPAIYRHTLAELGVPPQETLFIDDKAENIEAARALEMPGIQFSTVERLRAELIARGFDTQLPLPA